MCLAVSLALPSFASALSLGDADIRSFVGQPLDVRIDIRAGRNEWLDLSCVKAKAGDRTLLPLSSTYFRIQESLESRTLIVRTPDPIVTPYLTLELTVQCEGNAEASTRTYDLALPALVAPSVIIQQPGEAPKTVAAAPGGGDPAPSAAGRAPVRPGTIGAGGQWTTSGKDSLASIARGVYPRSTKMRAAFIARMRELNADTTLPADSAPLTPGLKLRLPDLVSLANQSPRIDPALRDPAAAPSEGQPARKPAAAPDAKAPALSPTSPPKPAATAPATVTVPARETPRKSADAAPSAPARTTQSSTGGFTLRLSGVEMDLSRSKGVSESTRAALRDKQLLLDADDQVAALLSLRNTVKQLEGRLNEMQLKLSTTTLPAVRPEAAPATQSAPQVTAPSSPPAAPPATAPTPAPKQSAEPPAQTPAAQPQASTVTPESAPQEAAKAPAATAPKATPAVATQPAEEAPIWTSPLVLGIGALLVLLFGWAGWRWTRRNRGLPRTLADTHTDPEAGMARERATSDLQGPSSDDLPKSEWDDDEDARSSSGSYRSSAPSAGLSEALREAEHQETVRMRAAPPDLLDASAASLELDTRPATSVDFVLGDEGGEDKSRRQRYMEERFPELAHRSISVDEPDSIIDAARHHYEEGQLQKAIELLTYAFEERPGQLRFWLALFEIHRLEQRVADFADLASRFKNVHGGTDAWPKVQHIGRDLDPGHPLYAAALGRLGVPMDADFDPMSENWLNVPMDFTSDVLMIELRHSLMAEHVVLDDELRRTLIEVPA